MDSHINITLLLPGGQHDLRIPKDIEVSHLIRELDSIFQKDKSRQKYQIRIVNKGIILDEGHHLKDRPVTTGDILEIMED